MSKDYLPIQVNPIRFAENAATLRGTLLVKNMDRLAPSLFEHDSEVDVDLRFGVDDQGIRFLNGHVATQLTLQCQRCLEPFVYEITSDFISGIVSTEKAALSLPENYDPMVVRDEILVIQDVVEEELILNLPIVAMHELKDCKVSLPVIVAETQPISQAEKENPFKVIELLKVKPKQE